MTSSPPRSPPRAPGSVPPPPDAPDVVARVREELPLVAIIARQLGRQLGARVRVDDLESFGHEGLLAASRTFDPTLGVPFRRWANYRVRGAMVDGLRSSSALPRAVYRRLRGIEGGLHASENAAEEGSVRPLSTSEEADARLGEYLAGIATAVAVGLLATPADGSPGEGVDQTPQADESLARHETLASVRAALAELPEHERHMIQRHYFDDVRLDEAAREIGLSKSWGSRLHGRAIESITRALRRDRPGG